MRRVDVEAVKIGCCGFPLSRKKYYELFPVVEVQQTFYKLPSEHTAEKWRAEAPDDFEFAVKAFQAITHPPTSPTWKKAGIEITPDMINRYGLLRPTEENFEAWENMRRICSLLKARICVVQMPPGFTATDENVGNMEAFFGSISRKGLEIAWEPRHKTWFDNPKLVKQICDRLDLIHVVDILKRDPVSDHEIAYTRLHGLGREINYRYKYTDADLASLKEKVLGLVDAGKSEVYVMFNNVYMKDDAYRFAEMLAEE